MPLTTAEKEKRKQDFIRRTLPARNRVGADWLDKEALVNAANLALDRGSHLNDKTDVHGVITDALFISNKQETCVECPELAYKIVEDLASQGYMGWTKGAFEMRGPTDGSPSPEVREVMFDDSGRLKNAPETVMLPPGIRKSAATAQRGSTRRIIRAENEVEHRTEVPPPPPPRHDPPYFGRTTEVEQTETVVENRSFPDNRVFIGALVAVAAVFIVGLIWWSSYRTRFAVVVAENTPAVTAPASGVGAGVSVKVDPDKGSAELNARIGKTPPTTPTPHTHPPTTTPGVITTVQKDTTVVVPDPVLEKKVNDLQKEVDQLQKDVRTLKANPPRVRAVSAPVTKPGGMTYIVDYPSGRRILPSPNAKRK